jgi:predicted ribosome quality control (RQC) complex YloA/Tae2 family protein
MKSLRFFFPVFYSLQICHSYALSSALARRYLTTTNNSDGVGINSFTALGHTSTDNNHQENKLDIDTVDLKGLKAETSRMYLRTFKKVNKCNERLAKAKAKFDEIITKEDMTENDFEECPNPDTIKKELDQLQNDLNGLATLEAELKDVKSIKDSRLSDILIMAMSLGVNDKPPPKQERGEKKKKGIPSRPRLPYHEYRSLDNIEIRVGRAASDNDVLSCDPRYRDGDEWWMHASGTISYHNFLPWLTILPSLVGCAGSHVVIKNSDNDFPRKYPKTFEDAALLAAGKVHAQHMILTNNMQYNQIRFLSLVNSKCAPANQVVVSFVRCRQVSKPSGAKAGLVRLNGDIGSITVDIKANQKNLQRLEATKNLTIP